MISRSHVIASDQAPRTATFAPAGILPKKSSLTLASAIWGFMAVGMLACTIALLTFVKDQHRAYQAEALGHAVTVRLNGIEVDFARALDAKWVQLDYLTAHYNDLSPDARRTAFDMAVGSGDQVSWVGFAPVDGIVATASGGLLEGKDVSQRPWFQQGLERNYAGDVHEAVLLRQLLKTSDGEPMRFIDLARPVTGADGKTIGVIGMHINFAWAQNFLTKSARSMGLDVYLVNEAGKVVLATDNKTYDGLDLASIGKAEAGIAGSQLEAWPDGRVYFTSVLPSVTYGALPSFGWRMVGRIDLGEFAFAETNLLQSALKFISGLGLFLLGMTVIFQRVFVRPISALAQSASRIAAGETEYPYEGSQTIEIAQLSASLSLLQWRRH